MMTIRHVLGAVAVLGCLAATADAGIKSKAAKEAADYALRKFGVEVAEAGAETLAKRIESQALKHGDEVFDAVRKVGPDALRLVDDAGEQGGKVAKLLSRHGDAGLWVARDSDRLGLFFKHGDEAAEAMIKHKAISQPLVSQFGLPAARTLTKVNGQGARRLAMLAKNGDLAKIGRTDALLGTIARFGDRGMDFVWRNKGALMVAAALTAFLADPEPFIDGTIDLATVAGREIGRPLTTAAAGRADWTTVLIGVAAIAATAVGLGLLYLRLRPTRLLASMRRGRGL